MSTELYCRCVHAWGEAVYFKTVAGGIPHTRPHNNLRFDINVSY